ncbi:MAG: hypothetical protein ACYDGY_09355 [Acidimicrobiales bacterium]
MAGPDPLGKRALFWVTPQEDGKEAKRPTFDEGRRAFYSNATGGSMMREESGRSADGKSESGRSTGRRSAADRSKRSSDGSSSIRAKRRLAHAISQTGGGLPRGSGLLHGPDGTANVSSGTQSSGAVGKGGDIGMVGTRSAKRKTQQEPRAESARESKESCPFGILCVDITCGFCKASSTVNMTDFFWMHWPVWLWLPGKGNTHLLVCPSCRKRTWVSVSWPSSGGVPPGR